MENYRVEHGSSEEVAVQISLLATLLKLPVGRHCSLHRFLRIFLYLPFRRLSFRCPSIHPTLTFVERLSKVCLPVWPCSFLGEGDNEVLIRGIVDNLKAYFSCEFLSFDCDRSYVCMIRVRYQKGLVRIEESRFASRRVERHTRKII